VAFEVLFAFVQKLYQHFELSMIALFGALYLDACLR